MNTTQSIPEAIRQVIKACAKGDALFSVAITEPAVNGWLVLDTARATQAYIDLEAALNAVRSIAQQIAAEALPEFVQYLGRAENCLEYSLATISTDAGNQVKAHASRAQSAQRQLAGLSVLSEQALEQIGRSVVADIAAALGRSNC